MIAFNSDKVKKIFRIFLNKMYYIGGAVVLVSLIFKFTSLKGSDTMLIVGLLMEAIIFFLGAFDTEDIELGGSTTTTNNNNNNKIQNAGDDFFKGCGINLNKYYSEINADMKKLNFKIQSFEMMKKIQNVVMEQSNNDQNLVGDNKKVFDNMIGNFNKTKNDEKKNIDKVVVTGEKRRRGRPRKNPIA